GITGLEANDRAQRNLEETQKHPTAIGHQLTGLLLLDRGSPTAALAEFKEAIALEPADSWAYVHMGLGLTGSGRPSEAIEHIGMAMRLDPHPPPVFFYYLGLAQFCEGKYDAAAASLEKATRLNPDLEFAFIVQAATDGHLGREHDGQVAVGRYNEIRVARGFIPVTIENMPSLYIKNTPCIRSVKKGLRLAGVPEFLFDGEFAKQNTLTADEARALSFDHQLKGRHLWTGKDYTVSITSDGAAAFSGDWDSIVPGEGPITFKDNEVCYNWSGGRKFCGTVLRNPGGTRVNQNEFIWFTSNG